MWWLILLISLYEELYIRRNLLITVGQPAIGIAISFAVSTKRVLSGQITAITTLLRDGWDRGLSESGFLCRLGWGSGFDGGDALLFWRGVRGLLTLFCCLSLFLVIFILSKRGTLTFVFSFSSRILSFILLEFSSWEWLVLLWVVRSTLVLLFLFGFIPIQNFEDFFWNHSKVVRSSSEIIWWGSSRRFRESGRHSCWRWWGGHLGRIILRMGRSVILFLGPLSSDPLPILPLSWEELLHLAF